MSTVLTENIVLSRTRQHDLNRVRKLNCWGSELSDVSIVERMPIVEVLSLSINDISSLRDFAYCKKLQELYLRKNRICDLNEIFYLKELSNLRKLSLVENPCAEHKNYRYTVLKALPHLQLLDNIAVTTEELTKAQTLGDEVVDPSELNKQLSSCPTVNGHQKSHISEQKSQPQTATASSQPVYEGEEAYEEYEEEDISLNRDEMVQYQRETDEQLNSAQPVLTQVSEVTATASPRTRQAPQMVQKTNHEWKEGSNKTLNQTNSSSSSSASSCMLRSQSVGDYTNFTNCTQTCCYTSDAKSCHSDHSHESYNNQENPGERYSPFQNRRYGYKSIHLLTNHQQKGLSKGGKNRNGNILSAVLCLIKELDYASLEVVETHIHCRMEEMEENA